MAVLIPFSGKTIYIFIDKLGNLKSMESTRADKSGTINEEEIKACVRV